MEPSRRRVLAGAGLSITSLALPPAAAAASPSTPAGLIGAETVPFTSPGYVDLVAGMSGDSGTESVLSANRWHLGYAYVELAIDGFRLFGRDGSVGGGNTTFVNIAVAPAPGVTTGFGAATQPFSGSVPFTDGVASERTFPAVTVPAGHHFLIAVAGGNAGRALIPSSPSRIGTIGGQAVVGFETGYWRSDFSDTGAATLNGFTAANRLDDEAMDRVGWRITVAD